jgi:nitronate monooxygenase
MWPDRRLLDLLNIEHPIIQAPMAGAQDWALAAVVAEARAATAAALHLPLGQTSHAA